MLSVNLISFVCYKAIKHAREIDIYETLCLCLYKARIKMICDGTD